MQTSPRQAAYAETGVHLDLGDATSQVLYSAARQTWEQGRDHFGDVIIPQDDFSGVRYKYRDRNFVTDSSGGFCW